MTVNHVTPQKRRNPAQAPVLGARQLPGIDHHLTIRRENKAPHTLREGLHTPEALHTIHATHCIEQLEAVKAIGRGLKPDVLTLVPPSARPGLGGQHEWTALLERVAQRIELNPGLSGHPQQQGCSGGNPVVGHEHERITEQTRL